MKKSTVLTVAVVAAMTLTGLTQASEREQDRARALSEAGAILPLEYILDAARMRHPGRVLETELEQGDAGYYYEVEIVDAEGVVRELKYDAASGELLSDERDD